MKFMPLRFLAVIAAFFTSLSARAESPADHVPADALVYIHWQGADSLKTAYAQSHLKAILDHSSLPEFFNKKLPDLILKAAGPDDESVTRVLDTLATLWHKPSTLYVGAFTMKDGQPMPRIAIVCAAGDDAATLEKNLNLLIKDIGEGPASMKVARNQGNVIVEFGDLDAPAEKLLLGLPTGEGNAAPLSGDKTFQSTIANIQKDAAFTVYSNLPAWIKSGEQLSAMDPKLAEMWPTLIDVLNLAGLRGAALSMGFDGKDWAMQAFLGTDGTKTGILSMFDAAPLTDDQLKLVPADATWMVAAHLDLGKLAENTMTVIEKIAPDDKRNIDREITSINKKLAIDLQKDLLNSFGDTWIAYSSPTVAGNGITGLAVVNVPKDAAKLGKAIEALEKFATPDEPEQPEFGFRFGPRFKIQHTTIAGIDVHHLPAYIVNPSWAITDGKLIMGLYPNTIPAAADAAKAKTSILDNPKFTAMRKRLGGEKASSLMFHDVNAATAESYGILAVVQTLAESFVPEEAPPTLLPPLHNILPEVEVTGGAAWMDQTGWHYKSIESIPFSFILGGTQGMVVGAPVFAAAILMPSLGRARELSNRAYDAANAAGIMKAAVIYANDNGDKLPEHLAELVAKSYISTKQLVKRGSGTPVLELTPEQFADAQKDWHKIEKLVDAHCDWIYLGKGATNDVDASEIVLFQKPSIAGREGITVGYSDAHALFLRAATIADEFTATDEKRKKNNLPPTNIKELMEEAGMGSSGRIRPGPGRPQIYLPPVRPEPAGTAPATAE